MYKKPFALGIILLFLLSSIIPMVSSDTPTLNNTVYVDDGDESRAIVWSAKLDFNPPKGAWVILCEDSFSWDGPPSDPNDLWAPPPPPSGLGASLSDHWSMPALAQDCRHYPDTYKIWNLTVTYNVGVGNPNLTVTVNLAWNSSDFTASEYAMVSLMDDNFVFIADMLATETYTFNITDDYPASFIPGSEDFHIVCTTDIEPPVTGLKHYWNLMSLPFNQSISKDNLIVNYSGTDHNWSEAVSSSIVNEYIFGWNRSTQSYFFADILEPGYGYWLYAYDTCELRAEGVIIRPGVHIADIKQYWNTMGVPDSHNVSKTNLIINHNGTDYNWTDAVTAGIVNDVVFGWDRYSQSYNFADTFMPGYAYWMYAYQPCTLKRVT